LDIKEPIKRAERNQKLLYLRTCLDRKSKEKPKTQTDEAQNLKNRKAL
jgi:hypothetical protein